MRHLSSTMVNLVSLVLVAAIMVGVQSAKAEFVFGTPTQLGPPITINSSYVESVDCISTDGLELYLDSKRPGGVGGWDLWVAKRDTTDADWGEPVNLGPGVNFAADDTYACILQDGLELYFNSENRPGGYGGWDIWVTRRATKEAGWGSPVNLGPTVNGPGDDGTPWVSADGRELYFLSGKDSPAAQAGGASIWVARRDTKSDPWGAPEKLGPAINKSVYQGAPCLSANGLSLFFSDVYPGGPFRPGGLGGEDIWVTTRATTDDEWGIPRNLGRPVNSPLHEDSPRLSPDGSTLYFNRGTGFFVFGPWQVPIVPIVDFNGDGKVDMTDLLRLIEHWGQNEPAFDIAPPPFGDGIVDANDLDVLMSYWGQEVNDPRLAAHWRLDETEGNIAEDGAGDNDGILFGESLWQPTGGKKDGALQLDGIDDYIGTEFVLNPSDGPFIVFAWIKGGAPGNALISQVDGIGSSGETWLGIEPVSGKLMTSLVPPHVGRFIPKPLVSEYVITDGRWHHIGFLWDGAYRSLYVDGTEVTKDTAVQNPLKFATGGMYIGAGKTLDATSFFSGLIDDVRIYDVALTAEETAALAQ